VLIEDFLRPRTLIVSGKGGVGKTTVAAALALVAARHSRRVCVAEVDRKGTLAKLLGGGSPGYEPTELLPGIWGLSITPEDALAEYLDVQYHMKRISRVLTHSHFIDYITTAAPGLKDILVLGKVWYLEQGRAAGGTPQDFDTIVLDAQAAGHMRSFLAAPIGLSDAVRVGAIRRQSDWLLEMLRDPSRTRVHLVTLAEEMPVQETLETSATLEAELRIAQGTVFANAIYSDPFTKQDRRSIEQALDSGDPFKLITESGNGGLRLDEEDADALVNYARFLTARRSIQRHYLRTLRSGLPQPLLELPFLFSAGLALPDGETLADAIEDKVAEL
jgi:anion-transporting  ArsA/GET3 family ATPase